VVLLGALALTFWWRSTRPLRGYVLAYLALLVGYGTMGLIAAQPAYAAWAGTMPLGVSILVYPRFGPVGLQIVPILLVAATLIGSGLHREDVFLRRGDLNAPIRQDLVFRSPQGWWPFARWMLLFMSILTAGFLAIGSHYSLDLLPQVLLNLPLILVAAGMNAFTEEFIFRSVLLARLVPVLGATRANWLQAAMFGLGHFFGTPSGPVGVVMATLLGWLNGKSVLETRGFTVAFLLHFVQDAIIFAFFLMAVA
jgi:membrane protease YdiL (CAAX protease family)